MTSIADDGSARGAQMSVADGVGPGASKGDPCHPVVHHAVGASILKDEVRAKRGSHGPRCLARSCGKASLAQYHSRHEQWNNGGWVSAGGHRKQGGWALAAAALAAAANGTTGLLGFVQLMDPARLGTGATCGVGHPLKRPPSPQQLRPALAQALHLISGQQAARQGRLSALAKDSAAAAAAAALAAF